MAPIFHCQNDLSLAVTFLISMWLFSAHFFLPKVIAWQQWPNEMLQLPAEESGILSRPQSHCKDKIKWMI